MTRANLSKALSQTICKAPLLVLLTRVPSALSVLVARLHLTPSRRKLKPFTEHLSPPRALEPPPFLPAVQKREVSFWDKMRFSPAPLAYPSPFLMTAAPARVSLVWVSYCRRFSTSLVVWPWWWCEAFSLWNRLLQNKHNISQTSAHTPRKNLTRWTTRLHWTKIHCSMW